MACGGIYRIGDILSTLWLYACCVDDCHVEDDRIRIDNAMAAYGYKFEGQRGDVLVYRAEGLFKRLTLMFEDEIEVRKVASGVEIVGIRRTTARVVYQLRSYLNNRRYE